MTKAYVITIMDNDKSVEVAKRCVGSAQLRGTEVEMFPAITPKDDPVKLLEAKGIDPKAFDEVYSRNLNCIAAFLSHHSLWEKCAKGNENFVIFEHDAFVHSPIPVNAKFAYVMNIGQPSYGSYNTPSVLGVNPLTTKRYFGGAHAYMVDTIVLIAPIWNFRMPAIVEGWIDKVLAPPWAFKFKQLWGNYGYPIGNLRQKKAIIFCTYGSPRLAITTFFLNLPIRRLKRGVFHMCGIYNIVYRRYFAVPFVSDAKREEFLEDVKKTANNI